MNSPIALQEPSYPASSTSVRIVHVYLKDIEMHLPQSPAQLPHGVELNVNMQLQVGASQLQANTYEVALRGQIQARVDEQVAYEINLTQAGLFEMGDMDDVQIGVAIGVHCAQTLYPYLRSYVADTVTRAGFVALHLGEVHFSPVVIDRSQTLPQVLAPESTTSPEEL